MSTGGCEQYDFSQPGNFRDFELVVGDKSIFVNAHSLAQFSDYFANLCFGEDFIEKKEHKVTITGEKYRDILEMVSCIHLINSDMKVKPVTAEKFSVLLRLANKFLVGSLFHLCEQFVMGDQFDSTKIAGCVLIDMLRASIEHGLCTSAQNKLLNRVAGVASIESLKQHNVIKWLPPKTIAALFVVVKENEQHFSKHQYGKMSELSGASCLYPEKCWSCNQKLVSLSSTYWCLKCKKTLCSACLPFLCERSVYSAGLMMNEKCPTRIVNFNLL